MGVAVFGEIDERYLKPGELDMREAVSRGEHRNNRHL